MRLRTTSRKQIAYLVAIALSGGLTGVPRAPAQSLPWLRNKPIASVQREIYIHHTQPGVGVAAEQYSSGPAGQRIEIRATQAADDQATEVTFRFSPDNGRTWSQLQALPNSDLYYGNTHVFENSSIGVPCYDSRAGIVIQPWLRQVIDKKKIYCHAYYRLSLDYGQIWSTPRQLKYEPGADFDRDHPMEPEYLTTNNANIGAEFAFTSKGNVVMGVGRARAPSGGPAPSDERLGAVNFVGTWNGLKGAAADYTWQASNRIAIASSYSASTPNAPVSTRGLAETGTVVLKDGRILEVYRGSNARIKGPTAAKAAAAHKWFTISSSDGLKLGPLQELKYDDGTSFYSPSSMNRLMRNEGTGKLYLIGNISAELPNGNRPRWPLVIAEIDEKLIAVKKSTVTVITDRGADEPSNIQFSNFSLLDNFETHQFELFLSNYGVDGAPSGLGGDSLKFTLTFPNSKFVGKH